MEPIINGPQEINTSKSRLNVSNVDALGRQRRDPNTRKDFKQVLDGDVDAKENDGEENPKVVQGRKSIFDVLPSGALQSAQSHHAHGETPQTPTQTAKKQKSSAFQEARGDLSDLPSDRPLSQFVSRQSFDIDASGSGGGGASSPSLQQVVDQIVDSLYILKTDGGTETVVMLKHPPELAGAELSLTSFNHAKGEFNIGIHNLTQAAQLFLEQNNIRMGLKQALEEHGYTVHIITMTPEPIKTVAMESTESTRQDRQDREDGKDDQQSGQGRRNR